MGSGRNAWVVEAAFSGLYSKNLPFWIGMGEHVLPDAYHRIGWLGSRLLANVPNPFYGQIPAGSSRGGETITLGNLYQSNPLWQQISTTGDPIGTANYTAGYVQIEHRFGGGFSFLANYTLSKLMQDTGGVDNAFSQGFPQAGLGPADVYGIARTDQRHKLIVKLQPRPAHRARAASAGFSGDIRRAVRGCRGGRVDPGGHHPVSRRYADHRRRQRPALVGCGTGRQRRIGASGLGEPKL